MLAAPLECSTSSSHYPQISSVCIPSYPGPNSRRPGPRGRATSDTRRAARPQIISGAKPRPPPAAHLLPSPAAGCGTGPRARNRPGPAAEGGAPDPAGSPRIPRRPAARGRGARSTVDCAAAEVLWTQRGTAGLPRPWHGAVCWRKATAAPRLGGPPLPAAAGLPHGIGVELQNLYELCIRWQWETAGQGYVGSRARAIGGGRVAGGKGVARRQARRRSPGRARWSSSGTPGRRWPTAQMTSRARLRAAGPRARCRPSTSRWVRPAPRAPRALSIMQRRRWCILEAAALRVELLPTCLVHVPRRKAGRDARL